MLLWWYNCTYGTYQYIYNYKRDLVEPNRNKSSLYCDSCEYDNSSVFVFNNVGMPTSPWQHVANMIMPTKQSTYLLQVMLIALPINSKKRKQTKHPHCLCASQFSNFFQKFSNQSIRDGVTADPNSSSCCFNINYRQLTHDHDRHSFYPQTKGKWDTLSKQWKSEKKELEHHEIIVLWRFSCLKRSSSTWTFSMTNKS